MNIPQTTAPMSLSSPVITSMLTERADAESSIRPATTKAFTKDWVQKPFDFPNLGVDTDVEWVANATVPQSTRAIVQNAMLIRRHFDK